MKEQLLKLEQVFTKAKGVSVELGLMDDIKKTFKEAEKLSAIAEGKGLSELRKVVVKVDNDFLQLLRKSSEGLDLIDKAEQALNLGYDNVRKFGRGFETAQASTEAAFISAGVKMEGTPMEVLEHNIYEGEIEKMNIMYDARMQSYDFKQGAVSSRMEGEYAMFQARAARSSAIISAVGTMVGAAGNYMLATESAAQAKALMTQNASYATQILNTQAKNNKILMDLRAINAQNLTLKTNENLLRLNQTAIDNSITLNKYPCGFPVRSH